MKTNHVITLIVISFLFFSNFLNAEENIRHPQLSKIIDQANELVKSKNFSQAAEKLLEAINIENPEAKAELNEFKDKWSGPYKLKLYSDRLWYLKKSYKEKSPEFGAEVQAVIDEYNEEAQGKNWNAYKWLFLRLADYHKANKNGIKEADAHEKRYLYNPNDQRSLIAYLYYLLKNNPSKIDEVIVIYKEAGGEDFGGLALFNCKRIEKQGENPFNALVEMLKKYPTSNFRQLKDAMEMLRQNLDPEKPQQINKYYNTLKILAIKQPSNEKSITAIAYILNEKKKLEAIMPKLKK